ncbi:MAG: mandelate racemase/muconate lactonizing enzyme family protein [Rhizobiaceae bacterium]
MPKLARCEIYCYQYPLVRPLETVLGRVESRPSLIIRLEDEEGAVGYGEIWCNFPPAGASYRSNLASDLAAIALKKMDSDTPSDAFKTIRMTINLIALQAGELGPADQISAGFDNALHEIAARRKGVPLAKLIGGELHPLRAYASGIGPPDGIDLVIKALAKGYTAFKLRIGFGNEQDLTLIDQTRKLIGNEAALLVDANQKWTVKEAIEMAGNLASRNVGWLEEPIAADRPAKEWQRVGDSTSTPIAAGENLRNLDTFNSAIAACYLGVIQPDICKWGGVSGCLTVAKNAHAAGLRYCPHYLGGGIGLATSAHLLSAVGGNDLLEVDANDNPLRDVLAGPLLPLKDGMMHIPDAPGIGYVPDLDVVDEFKVFHREVRIEHD